MRRALALGAVLALLATPALGGTAAYSAIERLVRVAALIERAWVDEITTEELVGAALDGMTARLDPWSAWLTPDEMAETRMSLDGTFFGVGVGLDDAARIFLVVPGSPAEREGLAAGDLILAVDDVPTLVDGVAQDEVIDRISGPRGTVVRLLVGREGWDAPRLLTVTRDEVHAPPLEWAPLPDGLVWLHLLEFQHGAAAAVDRALTEAGPYRGVVLDLRDNPGGVMEEAIQIADRFLAEGVILQTVGRMAHENRVVQAGPGGADEATPLVVLVNGRSASASEIVAAALQDHDRATLVGTPTWGKGTVQTFFPQGDGSALKITVARWLGPTGEPVAPQAGRAPDVLVPWPSPAADPAGALRQALDELPLDGARRQELRAHVDRLAALAPPPDRGDADQVVTFHQPMTERLADDPQLQVAVAKLRTGGR